jgi:shikimate dehydrogenase
MANQIDTRTQICGLIGYPIGHSVSPFIHNQLAGIYGQNLVYLPLQTEPDRLGDALVGADAWNFLGMNVTIPYKQAVIPYLKEIDDFAKQIGAVNTLVRVQGGYKGYNTDAPGLYRAMQDDGIKLRGSRVILLGAGGVARAVAYLLVQKGADKIFILNRTMDRGEKLAAELNAYADRNIAEAFLMKDYADLPGQDYLAIQATNVGMYPETEQAVIEDPVFYQKIAVGYDIIFNPPVTRFMRLVRKEGKEAYNGLKMLLYQGIIAYEYWNQTEVRQEDADRIYNDMLRMLEEN